MKQTEEIKDLVKQDINFLEFPNWIIAKRSTQKEIIIKKENGTYTIKTSADRLPDRIDKIIFYYCLKPILNPGPLFKNEIITNEVQFTRYRIVKDVFGAVNKQKYERLEEALRRWRDISIEFKGVFYDGTGYGTRFYDFVSYAEINDKTKKVEVRFNDKFLEQLKLSNYYRMIDYKEFKKLKKDTSARLYEILKKQDPPFKIEARKLAEKLTLSRIYPSQILLKLKPAIREINEKTDLRINFSFYKNRNGETILSFDLLLTDNEQRVLNRAREVLKIKGHQINRVQRYFQVLHPDRIDGMITQASFYPKDKTGFFFGLLSQAAKETPPTQEN